MAWDALKQMADHYERSVKLSIVDFPLPYHRAAFKGKYQSQSLKNQKFQDRFKSETATP